MDDSAARRSRSPANPGVIQTLAHTAWARAAMAALPPGTELAPHTHDFPYVSLYVLGGYREDAGSGAVSVDGPAAVLHPAGSRHSDRIGEMGLTAVVIEFDPAWLARALGGASIPAHSTYWRGGAIARHASALARACLESAEPATLEAAGAFLAQAIRAPLPRPSPAWLAALDDLQGDDVCRRAAVLARRLSVSGPWLARAYRAHRGEGLAETHRRWQVEHAVRLLTDSHLALAEVALDAGFCDQSHMNRAFRAVLRCTPGAVRRDRRATAA